MLPAIGMVIFYAVATHNIPRYGEPAEPVTVVLVILMAQALIIRAWQGVSEFGSGEWREQRWNVERRIPRIERIFCSHLDRQPVTPDTGASSDTRHDEEPSVRSSTDMSV